VKSPQTNGICERFHKTLLDEFYRVAFRKKLYDTLYALQADLDDWMVPWEAHKKLRHIRMRLGSTEPRNTVTMAVAATQDSTSEWRELGAQVKTS
jgi:transposase InsO family protein